MFSAVNHLNSSPQETGTILVTSRAALATSEGAKQYFFVSLPSLVRQEIQEKYGQQVYATMSCWDKFLHCCSTFGELGKIYMDKHPDTYVEEIKNTVVSPRKPTESEDVLRMKYEVSDELPSPLGEEKFSEN